MTDNDRAHAVLTRLAGRVWDAALAAANRRTIRHGFHTFKHLLPGEREIITQLLGAATATALARSVEEPPQDARPAQDSRPAPEDREGVEDFINAARGTAANTALPPASELTDEDVTALKELLIGIHETGHEHEREHGALLIRTHDLDGDSTAVEVCTPEGGTKDNVRYLLALSLLHVLPDNGEHGLIRTTLSAYVEHFDA